MRFWSYIPTSFRQVILRLGIVLLMMSITRILFLIVNWSSFSQPIFTDLLLGVWVDCIAIGIWFIPFYVLSLFPNPFRETTIFQHSLRFLFLVTTFFMLSFNLIDVEYYSFTSKRSTSDLFTILGAGNDFVQLITAFLVDFWWLILTLIILLWVSNKLYQKTLLSESRPDRTIHFWGKELLIFLIGGALLFIIGRGGLGYRPADMLTVAKYTQSRNTELVLNTPLTIIKTIGKESLKEKSFFTDNETHLIYNPIKIPTKGKQLGDSTNIMVIILESFGNEWLGKKKGLPFTPFLDSLINESLYFSNGFANGRKSIEAMPAIFASIPSLLDHPYISSHYGTNKIQGLPNLLNEKGYSSAFFHGATNGSMKFDEFASIVGFQHYFGRTEYNNEEHCDNHWGVLDEYFNPWTAQTITKELKEPFIAGLFTLSSHHPYYIPKEHQLSLPKGPAPIAQSIAYGDMSLRLFFEQAKKEPWYDHTIFVLCADHTPAGFAKEYQNKIGMYQIPILFFDPKKRITPSDESRIFSQVDIMPTLLDLIGFNQPFYSFGNSFFNPKNWAVNYISGSYYFFKNDYVINFIDDKTVALYNYVYDIHAKKDSLSYYNDLVIELEQQLKGIIQRYNHDLIYNKMTP